MVESRIRWGIIGPGRIAAQFARALPSSRTGVLQAAASSDRERAAAFVAEHGGERAYDDYHAMLADPAVDAVYIANPHPFHPRWAVAAAEAGKHVLCEKPAAINAWLAEQMIAAARANGVCFLEAFMYRCHPQTLRLAELVREGAIGEVKAIQASFAFAGNPDPAGRHLDIALGGGAILDVGCYPVSFARLIAGAALGAAFADPDEVHGVGHLGETGVDEYASALLRFRGDITAECVTGVRLARPNDAWIFGSEGHIHVPSPWKPGQFGPAVIRIHRGKEVDEVAVGGDENPYASEADALADAVAAGLQEAPQMTWGDTLGNLRTLDRWRAAIGLSYPEEQPGAGVPVRGELRARAVMPTVTLRGLAKPVSRVMFGCDNQHTVAHADAVFDDFVERGGTAFDLAYLYGGGKCERMLGQWQAKRGVRDEIVLMSKGCHHPCDRPEFVAPQLAESLERLQTDHLDIYCLHRDNPEVPVDEWLDALERERAAGRIRIYGGSNWSLARCQALNARARERGAPGFAVVSNNFSLARMIEPIWHNCQSTRGPEWSRWLVDEEVALLPWSSQARGFFVRSDADLADDREIQRCWMSEDNRLRRERAHQLAAERGVEPVQIALAWVLHQPFTTVPLIGPRHIAETASSVAGLAVELSAEEVAWLDGAEALVG